MHDRFNASLRKYTTVLFAGLVLAGCEVTITPGVGTTINSTSPLFSDVIPTTTQSAGNVAQAAPTGAPAVPTGAQVAPTAQVASNVAQPATRPGLAVANNGATVANGARRVVSNVGTALPIGVSRRDIALFRTVVTEAGCNINTPELTGAVESQTGFDEDKIDRIVVYLARVGEVNRGLRSYRLFSGQCANA